MKNLRLLCFLAALAACLFAGLSFEGVSAGPAAPIEHTLFQPDGSELIAKQWGDEWSNGFETLDGYTIIQDDLGWWVYANLVDGQLKRISWQAKQCLLAQKYLLDWILTCAQRLKNQNTKGYQ